MDRDFFFKEYIYMYALVSPIPKIIANPIDNMNQLMYMRERKRKRDRDR